MFKIIIPRLKEGNREKIAEVVDPSFLDVAEEELFFSKPVLVNGEAYLAGEHLILKIKISTFAEVLCTICNQKIEFEVNIADFCHTLDASELKDPIYDFTDELRTAILLQVPRFQECNKGKCPERENLKKFLKKDIVANNPFNML